MGDFVALAVHYKHKSAIGIVEDSEFQDPETAVVAEAPATARGSTPKDGGILHREQSQSRRYSSKVESSGLGT
jgi:hypothetical protein